MAAYIDRFILHNNLSLQRVASNLPFTYTGADLYALCSDAMLKAITRQARLVDSKVAALNQNQRPGSNPLTVAGFFDHYATDEDTEVIVSEQDFDSARRELVPSVSYEELKHYEKVRMTFEGNGSTKKDVEKQQIAISAGPPTGNGNENGIAHERPLLAAPAPKDSSRRLSAAKLKGLREKTLNSLHRSKSVRSSNSAANSEKQDDSEDEYTIDTSHLANGNGKLVQSKGKGKGKGALGGFGDAAEGDDDLYA
jgi:peroxin-6